MSQSLINSALVNCEKATLVPVHRLKRVQNEIERFAHHETLNGFQEWIVNNLYSFDMPDTGFPVESIILTAVPHPFYAMVAFRYQGKEYSSLSFVMSDFERTGNLLLKALQSELYHMQEAQNIPLKRLAVHSGFAEYGRNNICYIDGMGSNFSFIAYFSDIPCDDNDWTEVKTASLCDKCRACLKNCPTGAIQSDRFLIDNEKCLSYLNESAAPFPEWLPKEVHHCVYDCLKCQIICPLNKEHVKNVAAPIHFTESETNELLSGAPFEDYPDPLKKKAKYLGMHQWPDGIARNIQILIEQGG